VKTSDCSIVEVALQRRPKPATALAGCDLVHGYFFGRPAPSGLPCPAAMPDPRSAYLPA
jgi:hypothetical protein